MVTLETEDSGCCREVAVVEGFKQELVYGQSAKKVAVRGGATALSFQVSSIAKWRTL